MNQPANIALLAIVAIGAIVAEQTFLSRSPRFVEAAPTSDALEGEVLSVDPASGDGEANSLSRKARVKLRSGEIVLASVGGCVVFAGQTTQLAKYGSGSGAFYVVTANGKNDS